MSHQCVPIHQAAYHWNQLDGGRTLCINASHSGKHLVVKRLYMQS